jgi:DNA-binding transcriptional LysR family regulator
MAINDQILSLVNAHPTRSQLRLGIPNGIATPRLGDLIKALSDGHPEEITFLNYNAEHLVRGLDAGYIDIAFVPSPPKLMPNVAAEWSESFFWVKDPEFNLKPAEPIPLVSWPGGLSDRIAIAALKRAGIRYTYSFISSSIGSRLAACLAGRGVMAVAERAISDGIAIARDPGLPELPSVPAGIYLRDGLDVRRVAGVVRILESMVNPRSIVDHPVQMTPGQRARVRTK